MGLFDRWDKVNQRRVEVDNVELGGDDWANRLNERTPGPAWAWALLGVSYLGWVGAVVIAVAAFMRRRSSSPESPRRRRPGN